MFSEYASRFLAQSQSRIGFGGNGAGDETPGRNNPLHRSRRNDQQGPARFQSTRSYRQRPSLGNPYISGGASISQFPFASRQSGSNAPLFFSAHDEFQDDEDDIEAEREQEIADFYALQRSRRQLGTSRLEEEEESTENESGNEILRREVKGIQDDASHSKVPPTRHKGKGANTKTSFSRRSHRSKTSPGAVSIAEPGLENVGLGSFVKSPTDHPPPGLEAELSSDNSQDPDSEEEEEDDDPPPIRRFSPTALSHPMEKSSTEPNSMAGDADDRLLESREAHFQRPLDGIVHPDRSELSSAPATISYPSVEPPRHDSFWGSLYIISLAAFFASFILVFLHTSAPSTKRPLGDTIYSALHGSYHLLAVDTLVAVVVSLVWLALLRSYVRPLIYLILVAVPVILFSFFLYPLISSFQGRYRGASIQDRAMRWFSCIPGILSFLWLIALYRGRFSLGKAVGILEFSCRIVASNPALLLVAFANLAGVIVWSWVWMGIFTRVFLGGHLNAASAATRFFIIEAGTWWLALFFIMVYLWTLGIMSGIQRATTAATVSQWYFHRHTTPSPTSRQVVNAAVSHATTTLFGTICLSTLLALVIRLPYLLAPKRLVALASLCSYTFLPSTMATLTNPLTLTYSAIHSQPLLASSQALSLLSFTSNHDPTSRVQSRRTNKPHVRPAHSVHFQARNTPSQVPLHSYSLALLLLRATRFIMSLALGFAAWVQTARSLKIQPAVSPSSSTKSARRTIHGSLYAYVIGLIAAAIGWAIMAAMDGMIAGVVDAIMICWGSEVGRGAGIRYCREADRLFSEQDFDTIVAEDV